jgi:hypothetical protein
MSMSFIKLSLFVGLMCLLLGPSSLQSAHAQDAGVNPFGVKPDPFGKKPDPFASQVDPFKSPQKQPSTSADASPDNTVENRGRSTKTLVKHCLRDGNSQEFCECQAQETIKLQRNNSNRYSETISRNPTSTEINQLVQDMQDQAGAIKSKCGHL